MVVQYPSYPHQKHGAISVLFTPKAGVNKHFLEKLAPGPNLARIQVKPPSKNVQIWGGVEKSEQNAQDFHPFDIYPLPLLSRVFFKHL